MSITATQADASPDAFELFDYGAFDATPLKRDPFDYIVVPEFVGPAVRARASQDFPPIEQPGNFKLESLTYGPTFAALIDEMQGRRFATHFEQKFGVDLGNTEVTISIRGHCEATDGHIHADHRSKIITLLLYFNDTWTHEDGKLRMLRSADDLEDYTEEVTPLNGTVLAFRRSRSSFHGHTQLIGERRTLQMSWSRTTLLVNLERRFNRATKPVRRLLNMS